MAESTVAATDPNKPNASLSRRAQDCLGLLSTIWRCPEVSISMRITHTQFSRLVPEPSGFRQHWQALLDLNEH